MKANHEQLFLFKLALALGRTVAEIKSSMTTDELKGWIAFNCLNPIDASYRNEVSNAIGFSSIVNAWGAKSKAKDFIPEWEPPPALPQSVLATQFIGQMKKLAKDMKK